MNDLLASVLQAASPPKAREPWKPRPGDGVSSNWLIAEMTCTWHGFPPHMYRATLDKPFRQKARLMNHSLRAGEKKRRHVPSGVTTGAASPNGSFFTCIGLTSTSSYSTLFTTPMPRVFPSRKMMGVPGDKYSG